MQISSTAHAAATVTRADTIATQARAFEQAFLAEMLRHAGSAPMQGAFGGGQGEAQFHSMLVDVQAKAIGDAGGVGLAGPVAERLARDVAR
jgi:Rod binding domain-containing protein